MTAENNDTYKFDFAEEVQELLALYPELQKHTVFIDAGEHSDMDADFTFHSKSPYLKYLTLDEVGLKELLKEKIISARESVGMVSFLGPFAFVILDTKMETKTSFNALDKDKFLFTALQHEVGHILIPDASSGAKHYAECGADSFSSIRYLQKFNDTSFLFEYMAERAYASLRTPPPKTHITNNKNNAYMTTRVIESIIGADLPFEHLTPEQTIQMAEGYAGAAMFTKKEMKAILSAHKDYLNVRDNDKVSMNNKLRLLGTTTLATADENAFTVGARAFNALLNPDGVEIKKGQKFTANHAMRIRFHDDMIKRAHEMECDLLHRELLETKGEILARANFPDDKPVPKKPSQDDNYTFGMNF